MRPGMGVKDGRRKLELGFPLLLVGPSLEGGQDLPCGWWASTSPQTGIQQGNFDLPFSSFPRNVWGPAQGNSLVWLLPSNSTVCTDGALYPQDFLPF